MDEIAVVIALMMEGARVSLDEENQHFVAPTPIHIEAVDIRAMKVLLAVARVNNYDIFATRDNLVTLMTWIPLVAGNKAMRQIEHAHHSTNVDTVGFVHLVDETLEGDIASPDLFLLAHRAYWWLVFVSKLVLGTRDAKGLDNILDEEE